MKYSYNGNLTYDERVKEVSFEINKKYNGLDKDTLLKIAVLDGIINDIEYKPENEFKRLYNMLFVINKNNLYTNIYNRVLDDMKNLYDKFFKDKECYEKYLMEDINNNVNLGLYHKK